MACIKLALIDLTTGDTPAALRPAPAFNDLIAAWLEQSEGEFAAAYGSNDVQFRVASGPADRATDELAMNFRDSIPEAPGALAYHQVVGGVPDIEIGVDLFDSIADKGTDAVSIGGGHELLETFGNPGANGWKDKGTGVMGAEETVDVVQNSNYVSSKGIPLPNFLLPAYFVPGATLPYDYLGLLASQSDLSQGYEIQASAPSDVQYVQGEAHHEWAKRVGAHLVSGRFRFARGLENLSDKQRRRKSHPYSRTYRMGVRIGA